MKAFIEAVQDWSEFDKTKVIIACGDLGYDFDTDTSPDDFEIDIYYLNSLKELAEQFVEEGLFGEIPAHLEFYIDFEAIAHDLRVDYSEITIGGQNIIYRSD